jgi:hypothetical protein
MKGLGYYMKKGLSVLTFLVILSSGIAGETEQPAAIELPKEAFELLAESASDPCSICAVETREKAFKILNVAFKPRKILRSNNLCRFMRSDACGENELILSCHLTPLPLLTFRFHTAEKHLVGVSPTDFTAERLARKYRRAGTGVLFEGAIEIVEYRYGDGPAYNYYLVGNHVQVHCRLLDLKRIELQ